LDKRPGMASFNRYLPVFFILAEISLLIKAFILGMEQLRQERVREQDIFNLNIARMKNEYVAKLKEIEMREQEMTLREKEGKKLNRKL